MADPTPKEIRERHADLRAEWKDIYDEGDVDMRCVGGDPWDPAERKLREDPEHRRPVISSDELGQYINQLVNEIRQNKRSPKVTPKGNGANDKTAEARADIIRGIEYSSKAQGAYCTAFENAVSRSYGFWMLGRRFRDDMSFEQELYIRRIPNPSAVLIDYNTKEADHSDMDDAFIEDTMSRAKFKSLYGKAEVADFSNEQMTESNGWVSEKNVRIAEYWKVQAKKDTLFLVDDGTPEGKKVLKSDLPEGSRIESSKLFIHDVPLKILRDRPTTSKEVFQYITNGLEILDKTEWLGRWVPVIPCFGKEIWLRSGSQVRRRLMSLVRLARDPYMLYCYYRSCQAEVVGMTPKIPYMGYEGQFATQTPWADINKIPLGFAEVKPVLDNVGGVLPLPRREIYDPPIQQLELGAEAARRAIQAAMGVSPLPTAAQRRNEKSGIALERIEAQQQKGSFHFIDNYDMGLENSGRQINYLLSKVHDSAQDLPAIKKDDSYTLMRVNDPNHQGKDENDKAVDLSVGEHEVTISTGPSFDSQRDAAADFVDVLVRELSTLPIDPGIKQKILAAAVRLKTLGPIGDQIVDMLDPKKDAPIPPQAMQAIQKGQQQVQAMHEYAKQVEQQLEEAQKKLDAKETENATKLKITELQERTKIVCAMIAAKSKTDATAASVHAEREMQLLEHTADVMLQDSEQGHEAGMAHLSAALAPPPIDASEGPPANA